MRTLGVPVTDATGLTGKYDYTIFWSTPATDGCARGDDADRRARWSEHIRCGSEQLGLKIEKRKGPVQMLVVDHVEKKPTEN